MRLFTQGQHVRVTVGGKTFGGSVAVPTSSNSTSLIQVQYYDGSKLVYVWLPANEVRPVKLRGDKK